MAGIAIITEACIGVKDRACVDVCPVQCIYEFDPQKNILFSEEQAGSGVIENTHTPNPDSIAIFGDTLLYVNLDECTSCTACYQPDVCPVGAIYSDEHVPNGSATTAKYNSEDPEQRSRPHVLHPAQSRRLRRLGRTSHPLVNESPRRVADCSIASTSRSIEPLQASRSLGARRSTWPASVTATTTGAWPSAAVRMLSGWSSRWKVSNGTGSRA